jgi:hypothetical protein
MGHKIANSIYGKVVAQLGLLCQGFGNPQRQEEFLFYWQGLRLAARQGETIAAALLANGVRAFGHQSLLTVRLQGRKNQSNARLAGWLDTRLVWV